MNVKISFNDAYKAWRNRSRRYSPESVVRTALQSLQKPASSRLEDMRQAPWLTLLLVKWVCQDRMADHGVGEPITLEAFDDLRQRLWNFPEQIDLGTRDTLPVNLFVRQRLRSQIGFQRRFTPGFMREAALLAQQPQNNPLRRLFEQKTGIGIDEYLDLAFATYAAILNGKRRFDIGWFEPLRATYTETLIDAYIACVSRTFPELLAFCRSLRGASEKRASEFYEFPVLSRYPFLRTGNTLECWHPAVFYRGMEGFVHSVLSEAGQNYMDRFSKLFEQHVLGEARNLQALFFNEDDLMALLPIGVEVPDGLLSYPDCNVFVESKAGMFDESLMTVGHSKIFADRTETLRKAARQGWSASVALRQQGRAPSDVVMATKDYLLIVTNKELSASRGTVLAEMYPPGTLEAPSPEASRLLPIDHIYVLSIEDFERLMAGVSRSEVDLPSFLDDCVVADRDPATSVFYFEQHLDRRKVPHRYSDLVANTRDTVTSRLERAFGCEFHGNQAGCPPLWGCVE